MGSRSFVFHTRLFLLLCLGFMATAVVGVVSHECGHYAALRYYGFAHARITYNYTHPGGYNATMLRQQQLREAHDYNLAHGLPYDNTALRAIDKEVATQHTVCLAAGPIQTWLAGTIGLLLLFINRRSIDRYRLTTGQWICVFLSMFWLRPFVNLFRALLAGGQSVHGNDELILAQYLGWPERLIYLGSGIAGAVVFAVVVALFVPAGKKVTFVCAAFIGGFIGMGLWMGIIGPVLLPLPEHFLK